MLSTPVFDLATHRDTSEGVEMNNENHTLFLYVPELIGLHGSEAL